MTSASDPRAWDGYVATGDRGGRRGRADGPAHGGRLRWEAGVV